MGFIDWFLINEITKILMREHFSSVYITISVDGELVWALFGILIYRWQEIMRLG